MKKCFFETVENILRNEKKCWYQHFFFFLKIFSTLANLAPGT